MHNPNGRIIALDVGKKRIGVASASVIARIAAPLTTLTVSDTTFDDLDSIARSEDAVAVVLGLPRDINGHETEQTAHTRDFAKQLEPKLNLPLYFQDEALTSVKAEKELAHRKRAGKGDVDSLAATYILDDFLQSGAV